MDVYLVPIGTDKYECYYEAPEETDDDTEVPSSGFFGRLRARFNEQLKEAERARHERVVDEPDSFLGRWQKRTLRWIAERIAEQRLLWHLRTAPTATLHVPDDIQGGEAVMRAAMKRDADFHRIRLVIHCVGLLLAIPVALVPGPNVLGYLFTFTVVGHYLAWRGAVNALRVTAWTIHPNPPLGDLRRAFALDAAARHRVIHDVARRLHLPRLSRFVEQVTTPSA